MNRKKEWIRRGVLAALILTAAVMVFGSDLKQETRPEPTPVPTAEPVERLLREEAYKLDLEALRALAQSGDEYAAEQMRKLIEMHQNEWAIEEALLNAGFDPCFVVVQNGSVTVMVNQEKITEENSAKILALCMAHADVDANNVRIMAY